MIGAALEKKEVFLLILALLTVFIPASVFSRDCSSQRALILLSSFFGPYINAASTLKNELKRYCPNMEIEQEDIEESRGLFFKGKGKFRPTIVLPVGTDALIEAQRRYPNTPKVFSMVLDPPQEAILGSNTFGVILKIHYEKELEQLKRIKPDIETIGCLYSKDTEKIIKELRRIVLRHGIKLIAVKLTSIKELEDRLDDLFRVSDAILAIPDTVIYNSIIAPRIIYMSIRYQKPFVGLSKKFTSAGALFSVDCDYLKSVRQAAWMAIEIMNGRAPERPIEYCKEFTIYFNLRTARLIGLEVSSEELRGFTIVAR